MLRIWEYGAVAIFLDLIKTIHFLYLVFTSQWDTPRGISLLPETYFQRYHKYWQIANENKFLTPMLNWMG